MVRKLNHYKVLGIQPTANEDEIKKAYRALVRTAHPDKGGSTERFQRIQKSYDFLLARSRKPFSLPPQTTTTTNNNNNNNNNNINTKTKNYEEDDRTITQQSENQQNNGNKVSKPYSWRAKTILGGKNNNINVTSEAQDDVRKERNEKECSLLADDDQDENVVVVLELREDAAESQPLVQSSNLEKIGDEAMRAEDFLRARECYTQSLAFSKIEGLHRYAELYNKRALCNLALEDYEAGLIDAEKSCSFRRLWIEPFLTCGNCLEKLERWSAAINYYKQAPKRDFTKEIEKKIIEAIRRCEEKMKKSSSLWVVENAHEGKVKHLVVKSILLRGNRNIATTTTTTTTTETCDDQYVHFIATCGDDNFVNVWSADGAKLARLKCEEDVIKIRWNDPTKDIDNDGDNNDDDDDDVNSGDYDHEEDFVSVDTLTLAIIGCNNMVILWKNMIPIANIFKQKELLRENNATALETDIDMTKYSNNNEKTQQQQQQQGDTSSQIIHLSGFHDAKSSITACAFSPIISSNRLATADSNGKIAVWDIQTGMLECTTKYHHHDMVNAIAWHPQTGASLTTVSNDGDGRVFDIDADVVEAGGCLHTLRWAAKKMSHVMYTNCGRLIVTATCDIYGNSGAGAYRILVWSSVSGRLCKWYDSHIGKITTMSWHPNPGTRNILITGSTDGVLRCFSIRASPSGAGKSIIQQDERSGEILKIASEKWKRTTASHNCVMHNEYGGFVAVASDDAYVRVYSSDALELLHERKCDSNDSRTKEQTACLDLAWLKSPLSIKTDDGKKEMSYWGLVTATSSGELRLWKIPRATNLITTEEQNHTDSVKVRQSLESCTWWDPNEESDTVSESFKKFQIENGSRKHWHYLGPGTNDKLEHRSLALTGSANNKANNSNREQEDDGQNTSPSLIVSDALCAGDGDVSEENLDIIEQEMQAHMDDRRRFMKDETNDSKKKRAYHEKYCAMIEPLRQKRGRIYRNLRNAGLI
jgi:hypothetical protein